MAAAYAYGIARNHPFLDGNKRTALVTSELFLNINGYDLVADDVACLQTFLSLADDTLAEEGLMSWLENNILKL